ncbi:hypothetical protein NL676_024647 [Syzygium grande]|nr:hypothetical protein NL676_024647 [Syzygium grande]
MGGVGLIWQVGFAGYVILAHGLERALLTKKGKGSAPIAAGNRGPSLEFLDGRWFRLHTGAVTPTRWQATVLSILFSGVATDMICLECDLVLEAHSINKTSKWRTFANESNNNNPVRVGGPYNPLLTNGGLSTVISKLNGSSQEVP